MSDLNSGGDGKPIQKQLLDGVYLMRLGSLADEEIISFTNVIALNSIFIQKKSQW